MICRVNETDVCNSVLLSQQRDDLRKNAKGAGEQNSWYSKLMIWHQLGHETDQRRKQFFVTALVTKRQLSEKIIKILIRGAVKFTQPRPREAPEIVETVER